MSNKIYLAQQSDLGYVFTSSVTAIETSSSDTPSFKILCLVNSFKNTTDVYEVRCYLDDYLTLNRTNTSSYFYMYFPMPTDILSHFNINHADITNLNMDKHAVYFDNRDNRNGLLYNQSIFTHKRNNYFEMNSRFAGQTTTSMMIEKGTLIGYLIFK